MGYQYRFSIYLKWQIGIMIGKDEDFIFISLPFVKILFGLQKDAVGIELFGKELKF